MKNEFITGGRSQIYNIILNLNYHTYPHYKSGVMYIGR